MSDHIPKTARKEFENWLKEHLALDTTKVALEDYVFEKIQIFHQSLFEEVKGAGCSQCTIENVLPCQTRGFCKKSRTGCKFHSMPEKAYRECPKNICQAIKEKIKKHHRCHPPSWFNTKSERWWQHPWEIAKCYLPPDGYSTANSAKETDLNGLLNVLLNHRDFLSEDEKDKCEMVRQIGRKVRHLPGVLIEDTIIQEHLEKLISFLELVYSNCKGAVKLNKAAEDIKRIMDPTYTIPRADASKTLDGVFATRVHHSILHIDKTTSEIREKIEKALSKEDNIISLEIQELIKQLFNHLDSISTGIEEEQYKVMKEDLRNDLITYYENENQAIPISPFTAAHEAPLMLFYAPVKKVVTRCFSKQKLNQEIRKQVTSLEDIFLNGTNRCRNVYITGKAGIGKTTFVKRLCLIWSHAKTETDFSESSDKIHKSELLMMQNFDFVFLILLRNMGNVSDVDEMVSAFLTNLSGSHNYMSNQHFLKKLLHNETCLIILDGLDEWSHPKEHIPRRKPRSKCTVLTTTREWVMHQVAVPVSKIEKQIEMVGLDPDASKNLISNVFTYLTGTVDKEKMSRFYEHVKDKDLENLLSTPVVLIQLLCLWHEGRPTGSSRCELYRNVVEFMLRHGTKKIAETEEEDLQVALLETAEDALSTPVFLQHMPNCKKYCKFIMRLGKLAFETLFGENKKDALVLREDVMKNYLSEQEIKCCFHFGILTQNTTKVYDDDEIAVIFIHKTFQEFFSAIFLHSLSDEMCTESIKKSCLSAHAIVDMANVFIFLSGMNFHKVNLLSEWFCECFREDSITFKYRRALNIHNKMEDFSQPLKSLQDMYIACENECADRERTEINIILEDLVYGVDCKREKYLSALRRIVNGKQADIKSLFINTEGTNKTLDSVISEFNLRNKHSLEKIAVVTEVDDASIFTLIRNACVSLKSFSIKSLQWAGTTWKYRCIRLSESTVNALTEIIPRLETFTLECFILAHCQLQNLLQIVSKSKNLKQICVGKLTCDDHGDSCKGVDLDLSSHPDLEMLEIGSIKLSHFGLNVSQLNACEVGRFPEEILTIVCDCLKNATRLLEFSCLNFETYDESVEKLLQTVCGLSQLRHIYLQQIEIGSHSLYLCEKMRNIESIELNRAIISISVVKELVERVETYDTPVTIIIRNSQVVTEEEYKKLRQDIKRGDKFVVLYDDFTELNYHLFVFRTCGNA